MAIDTKAKRYSMLGFAGGAALLIDPDGSMALADRIHLLELYSGIVPELAPTKPGREVTVPVNRMHFTL